MKLTDQFQGNFLEALHLEGEGDVVVTIDQITPSNEEKDKAGREIDRPILKFLGTERRWILNKTNGRTIGHLYGNTMENWLGKKIALYATTTRMGRDTVPCVRVRPWDPDTGKPTNIFSTT